MKIAETLRSQGVILHSLERLYSVDSVVDQNPYGRYGHNLGAEALVIHSKVHQFKHFVKCYWMSSILRLKAFTSARLSVRAVLSDDAKNLELC